jgi:hypothetical protein
VISEILITFNPACDKAFSVPPVEIISIPLAANLEANSTIPVLSDTLINARLIIFSSSNHII